MADEERKASQEIAPAEACFFQNSEATPCPLFKILKGYGIGAGATGVGIGTESGAASALGPRAET